MFESSQPASGAFSAVVRRIQVRQFGEPDEEKLHNERAQLNAGHGPPFGCCLLRTDYLTLDSSSHCFGNPHFGLVICCDSDV